MIDKNKMPLAVGVAFVGFTTQFGGGFASGVQLYQYFINYGIWTLIMPVLAQALLSIFFWYGMLNAFRQKTYDYRSFCDVFYGKTNVLFSNLYEIVYIMLICLAPAVAFATGGEVMGSLFGTPYWLNTVIIGVFIFLIALYGTHIVRKAAATLSVFIIAGVLVVVIPNIIVQWKEIVRALGELSAGAVPLGSTEPSTLWPALKSAVIYFAFQLASIGLMYQHVESLKDESEVKKSMIYMFTVNAVIIMVSILGMLAVAFSPSLINAQTGRQVSVPMMTLVSKGVGATVFKPIISLLILLGAVSTGVNMIAGIVARVVNAFERRESVETALKKRRIRYVWASLGFTILAFAIAQFGLLGLVKIGYSYLGYGSLIVVAIPFVLSALLRRKVAVYENLKATSE
ncbi:MAG: hypothetical protein LBQ97_09495 [Fusobacteriaceae bacterium]|nr:hypothetical protein [Fusobacteriaceae bacterium]